MKLDDFAEDHDQDEGYRATIEAFSSKVPLQASVLPSTIDNIAELIEQRYVKEVKTEEQSLLPFKIAKIEVVA
eukprot:248857-Karenia_brevis.AAC.1